MLRILIGFVSYILGTASLTAGSPTVNYQGNQAGVQPTRQSLYQQQVAVPAQVRQLNLRANRDAQGRKIYKENELIVSFKKTMTATSSAQMVRQYASTTIKTFGNNAKFNLIKIDSGESLDLVMAEFKSNPNIASVSYNYYVYSLAIPNDTFYGHQWGLRGLYSTSINVEQAWNHITDCRSVTVAVIDTGVNYTHIDLADNMVTSKMHDFVDNDKDVYPDTSSEKHGTNIAGIIGARGNNGIGTSGVCWHAKILPLRVLDETGVGTLANVASSIIYAVDNGAKVINMSLGATGTFPALDNAMNYALAKNVVVVAAAGNSGINNDTAPFYPCNYSRSHANVICVAAMDKYSSIASFSNRGANTVDVGAPGVGIYSASPGAWIIDNMTGWTKTGAWQETQCNFLSVLINAGDFCAGEGLYANNANEVAYKNFDLGSADKATLFYSVRYKVQSGVDTISVNSKSAGGDPFAAGNFVANYSGASPNNGASYTFSQIVLSNCFTVSCTIGFRIQSDASVSAGGVAVYGVRIETSQRNANSYLAFSGTSQAAPHVAGLAAMIMAWNPSYGYLETVKAIKEGGTINSTLSSITSTGKIINVMGSLKYINPPVGVSATVQ